MMIEDLSAYFLIYIMEESVKSIHQAPLSLMVLGLNLSQ